MPNIHFPQFKSVTEYCNHYFKKYNREAWLKVRKKRYEQIRNNDFYLDTNVETFKKEVLQFWELGYSYRNSKIRKESCEWVDFQDENGEAIEGGRIIDEIIPKCRISRFAFDPEILILAKRAGYKIKEIPVYWKNDLESKVKFKSVFNMALDLLKLRLNLVRGLYGKR